MCSYLFWVWLSLLVLYVFSLLFILLGFFCFICGGRCWLLRSWWQMEVVFCFGWCNFGFYLGCQLVDFEVGFCLCVCCVIFWVGRSVVSLVCRCGVEVGCCGFGVQVWQFLCVWCGVLFYVWQGQVCLEVILVCLDFGVFGWFLLVRVRFWFGVGVFFVGFGFGIQCEVLQFGF